MLSESSKYLAVLPRMAGGCLNTALQMYQQLFAL